MKIFDTNILIYSFDPSSRFHSWSRNQLEEAILKQEAVINPVILTELGVGDWNPSTLSLRILGLGIQILDLPWECAEFAAAAYQGYLNNRKLSVAEKVQKIPLPDFFIGGHAHVLSCPIVTADMSRYQSYFPGVSLIHP